MVEKGSIKSWRPEFDIWLKYLINLPILNDSQREKKEVKLKGKLKKIRKNK